MYLAYTYYIVNKITGQLYYGSRGANVKLNRSPLEDFWVYYFTSSKYIKELINLYGTDSFEFKILLEDNHIRCYWYEQDLIRDNISNKLCLNKYYIDSDTSYKVFSTAGMTCSDSTKLKISIANTGRTQTKESSIKKSLKTKGISTGPKSIEHRKNMSLSKKGKSTGRKGQSISTKGKTYEEIYGKEVAESLLKIRSAARKGKKGFQASGKNNPNAKSIIVDGILYPSLKDACDTLNITYYELYKITS